MVKLLKMYDKKYYMRKHTEFNFSDTWWWIHNHPRITLNIYNSHLPISLQQSLKHASRVCHWMYYFKRSIEVLLLTSCPELKLICSFNFCMTGNAKTFQVLAQGSPCILEPRGCGLPGEGELGIWGRRDPWASILQRRTDFWGTCMKGVTVLTGKWRGWDQVVWREKTWELLWDGPRHLPMWETWAELVGRDHFLLAHAEATTEAWLAVPKSRIRKLYIPLPE